MAKDLEGFESRATFERSQRADETLGDVPVPRIGGKAAAILEAASMRKSLQKPQESFSEPKSRIQIRDTDESIALALSLLLTSNILRQSGTILPYYKIEKLTQRIISQLNPQDVMRLEVEAFEILKWLSQAFSGEKVEAEVSPPEKSPNPEGQDLIAIIENAINSHEDLIMWYYTHSRGEYSSRRITPVRVDAEKYLVAFCHKRNMERNFRLSRISRFEFIEGSKEQDQCSPGSNTLREEKIATTQKVIQTPITAPPITQSKPANTSLFSKFEDSEKGVTEEKASVPKREEKKANNNTNKQGKLF